LGEEVAGRAVGPLIRRRAAPLTEALLDRWPKPRRKFGLVLIIHALPVSGLGSRIARLNGVSWKPRC